ncbi:hypothetical protein CDL12_19680 [Handroanthus impetiginosus]|uniref:Uncharacterized protein n=1 Tax=Handroanthus impetiginosus TaxID=429701 RepID=A0A2G9GR23_9LAMI|nr:hypothetical protein CDL12_19680 [Handroanthus impetiginosus]
MLYFILFYFMFLFLFLFSRSLPTKESGHYCCCCCCCYHPSLSSCVPSLLGHSLKNHFIYDSFQICMTWLDRLLCRCGQLLYLAWCTTWCFYVCFQANLKNKLFDHYSL